VSEILLPIVRRYGKKLQKLKLPIPFNALSQDIRKIADTGSGRTTAADIFCAAFDRDPLLNWTVQQDARRMQRLRTLFEKCIELFIPGEEIYLTRDNDGAALWVPSGRHDLVLRFFMNSVCQAVVLKSGS